MSWLHCKIHNFISPWYWTQWTRAEEGNKRTPVGSRDSVKLDLAVSKETKDNLNPLQIYNLSCDPPKHQNRHNN